MNGDADLSRAIGRIEGKLDAIHEDVQILFQRGSETNVRVKDLESHRDKQRGALALLSMLAAAVGSFLTLILKG